MQRKAYVPGVAALLAALLAGCTGGSGDGATADDSNPGQPGVATEAAEPGKYRTLPEPCGAVGDKALGSLLPGLEEIADEEQRKKAYAGEATLAVRHRPQGRLPLEGGFGGRHQPPLRGLRAGGVVRQLRERRQRGRALFAQQVESADLPEPTVSESESGSESASGSAPGVRVAVRHRTVPARPPPPASAPASSTAPSSSASAGATPGELQPRLLDDLGDEAFVDDELSSSGSDGEAAHGDCGVPHVERRGDHRVRGAVGDSRSRAGQLEMQDMARNLASQLADSLSG